FICQGAVLLIGSVSRRTFVPVVQTAYLVYHKQFCLSRTFFILFSSFFRNLVAYHSQQQFSSLSELAVRVKQFFHLFSKTITTTFTVGLQYSILPFPCQ
ncbi:hypothetical protein, partial [Gallintestinimicrobium sp.]|uniref:hypothetical protein n=1 Tax=Gallintestinimicrobium sp. TaxID=2981655 RepID=UPI00307B8981